jgi:two-component system alkaline phosphatase synthesis response regulator PhoP
MNERILVVDDEQSIVTLIEYNLSKAGFRVVTANDGPEAIEKAEEMTPDLIVLDLMLPGMDGLEVCRHLRQKRSGIPIIMVTARDDELDKVLGLELGADDYMTKPFSPRELTARVKSILRRVQHFDQAVLSPESNPIKVGELVIYPEKFEVMVRSKRIEITPKEFELLVYLANHKSRVLTREQLLNAVWNFDFSGDTRIVDVHISHLREKIEANTKEPLYIKTVRGLGYKLENPLSS